MKTKWIIWSLILLVTISIPIIFKTNPSDILSYEKAALLGLIEGITEYLPISSTGHLIIANHYLLDSSDPQVQRALNAYSIIIQGGAIFAVAILYRKRFKSLVEGLLGKNHVGFKLGRNLLFAFLPAAILGLLLNDLIDSYLFNLPSVITALVLGAFVMFWAEKFRKAKKRKDIDIENLTIPQAVLIGLFQCIAMWPGTSRSMATIVGGYWVGLKPTQAAEFSFLLGFITLSAASAYKIVTSGSAVLESFTIGPLLMGVIIATIFAILTIKWLINYLTRYGLEIFGYYRIILALILISIR